jgi:hypothetical protein
MVSTPALRNMRVASVSAWAIIWRGSRAKSKVRTVNANFWRVSPFWSGRPRQAGLTAMMKAKVRRLAEGFFMALTSVTGGEADFG